MPDNCDIVSELALHLAGKFGKGGKVPEVGSSVYGRDALNGGFEFLLRNPTAMPEKEFTDETMRFLLGMCCFMKFGRRGSLLLEKDGKLFTVALTRYDGKLRVSVSQPS
jgi:hypothetical protein